MPGRSLPVEEPFALSLSTVSEVYIFADSHGGAFGATSREYAWPSRLAKALDADLSLDSAIDGAVGVFDDSSATGDGGYNTVLDRLVPTRTAAPYITDWPLTILMLGMNDLAEVGSGTTGTDLIKAAWRCMLGRIRSSRIVEDSDTTFITYNGTWTQNGSLASYASGPTTRSSATVGNYFEFTVPSDVPAGTDVWIGTITGAAGQGGQVAITRNGSAYSTIDTRNLCARANEVQRIAIANATGGTYTLTWSGQTTGNIAYNADAATVQTALEALSNIAPGDISVYSVTGATNSRYVEWTGPNALTDVAAMTANGALLTGTGPTVTITTPRIGGYSGRACGHGWRVAKCSPGDVIRGTLSAVSTLFHLDWIGFEAEVAPLVLFPLRFKPQAYALWDGKVKGDADVNLLRQAQRDLLAEFDGRVITFDGDTFGQAARYFVQTDFAHLSDSGHEIYAGHALQAIATRGPRDARSAIVAAQRKADPAYSGTWKTAVKAATTGNINVNIPGGSANFDGVALAAGERALVWQQTAPAENGIYISNGAASPLLRDVDANSADRLRDGTRLVIQEGTRYANREFILYTNGPYTLGTTSIQFTRTGSRMVEASADTVNATTTAADITGLGIAVAINETIQFAYTLVCDTSGATPGLGLGINCPASPTALTFRVTVPTTTALETIFHSNTPDAASAQTGSPGTTRVIATITGVLRNGANAGTLIPRLRRTGASGTVNVRIGSYGEWR